MQVLCEVSKLDEGLARSCLCRCPLFLRMTSWEQQAAALYLQSRQDLLFAFAGAAMASLISAYKSPPRTPSPLWSTLPLTQHGVAAWVPIEGHVTEGVSLQHPGWRCWLAT